MNSQLARPPEQAYSGYSEQQPRWNSQMRRSHPPAPSNQAGGGYKLPPQTHYKQSIPPQQRDQQQIGYEQKEAHFQSGLQQGQNAYPNQAYENQSARQTYGSYEDDLLYPNRSIVPIDPAYIQLSNTHLPRSPEHANTKLPFACVLQPMSHDSQTAIPTVRFEKRCGIIRCKGCRAYINPFVKWRTPAQYDCNLCGCINQTPGSYACELQNGVRLDITNRPELSHCTVEINAPEQYTLRPPQDPGYIFLINVHRSMGQSGALNHILDSIRDNLDALQGGNRCRVMLITYDSQIHFYKCVPGKQLPQVLTVPDLTDAIVPCPWKEVYVRRTTCRDLLLKVIESIPVIYKNTSDPGSCLERAISLAGRAAREVGGKMMVFNWGRPNTGASKLEDRLKGIPLGDAERLHDLQLDSNKNVNDYEALATQIVKLQVSIDLYQFTGPADEYVDLATLRDLPKCSGGNLRYYPKFNDAGDGSRLYAEIQHELTRETGWEAVIRVRCSSAFDMENHIGSFLRRSNDLLSIPVCHSDTNIALEFQLKTEEPIKQKVAYVQAVLLYTTSSCQRKIRVHNMPILVAQTSQELWNGVDMSIVTNIISRQAALNLLSCSLEDGRIGIQTSLMAACQAYVKETKNRLFCSKDYPPSWCTWPLMTLGMLKSKVFRNIPVVDVDERSAALFGLLVASPQVTDLQFRPSIYPLHELIYDQSLGLWTEENLVTLPAEASGSMASLQKDGMYLVDDANIIVIWCGDQLSPEVVGELFLTFSRTGSRFPNVQGLTIRPFSSENAQGNRANESPVSLLVRVWNVLEYLRSLNPTRVQKIVACSSQTSAEIVEFTYRLFEDGTENVMSYSEFMDYIENRSPAS